MISYLKESTFAVNEVIIKAWQLTRKHYFSLATLCFLMFITSLASNFMAFFMNDVNWGLRFVMALSFLLCYLTLNLSLFKYTFHLLDDEEAEVTIVNTLPTRKQIIRFLIALFYFVLCIAGVYLLVILIGFPFIYIFKDFDKVVKVAMSVGLLVIFITWLRISFFPFFIIDKDSNPFNSIKLSLAITKGNFTKLVLLLLILGGMQLLYLFFSVIHWPIVSFCVNLFSSFIVVPLSSVALTVAYRKMMHEYEGEQEPGILNNLV